MLTPLFRFVFSFCFFITLLLVSVTGRAAIAESEKLAYLGKVWGYLKYHHPQVGRGASDWDAVLLQAIPKVKAAATKKEFNVVLIGILNQAGPVPAGQLIEDKPAALKRNIDLAWFKNANLLDKPVTDRLQAIQKAFVPRSNYYVSNGYQSEQTGQPVFTNEKTYEEIGFPDEKHRILALFRYWNAVNYFYPHKYLLGSTWQEILPRFIFKIQSASKALAYQLVFVELAATLNDAQAGAFSPLLRDHFGAYSLPFRVSYLEGQTVVNKILSDSLAAIANIKPGDILLEIDNQPIDVLRQHYLIYTGSPNEAARQHAINQKLIMGKAAPVTLVLQRGSEKIKSTTHRYRVDVLYARQQKKLLEVKPWRLMKEKDANYGYLPVTNLTTSQVSPAFAALENTKGLIIDLRTFLFTPLVYHLIAHLYDQKTEFTTLIEADATFPGTWLYSPPSPLRKENAPIYKGKIVILVNENTFGLSELTAVALRKTPGAVIMGSQTAGAYGNVSSMILPGGVMLTFTGQGALYSDGTTLQRQGVKVDVEVRPTINSISKGHDELLERSILYLQKEQ